MNPTKFMFANLTMLVVGLAAFTTITTMPTNAQAQEVGGEYCFTEENADKAVVGFTCFPTKSECQDFQHDIKKSIKEQGEEQTGVAKVTNCKET